MAGGHASRRGFLATAAAALGGAGLGGRALAQDGLSVEDVKAAERLLGIGFTSTERTQMLDTLEEQLDTLRARRAVSHDNGLAPAHVFDPRLPGVPYPPQPGPVSLGRVRAGPKPSDPDDIAYAPLWHQAAWLDAGTLTSRELVELYLDRIARFGPRLECFVTVSAETARAQADAADAERRAGRRRGALHGLVYGLKDLFDAAGTPSTWGATPYKDREPAVADSAIAARLKAAGAILIAKTTLGALAYGDQWFEGRTRNPWNPAEGSSGSSAGSASAVAAGLVSFAIGTETLGSIISPSHRCGTVGLRPTFGRVSRAGGMALCWSLDKAGPITRDVGDAAFVLDALNGADPADPSSIEHDFAYDGDVNARGLVVGYDPRAYEGADPLDVAAKEALVAAGATLQEVRTPSIPAAELVLALKIEAAAAFEDLTLSNRDDELVWQGETAWPNTFRAARLVSAIDYVQIDRARRAMMGALHEAWRGVDVVMGPNFAQGLLVATNFSGHPQLAVPVGFAERAARPLTGEEPSAARDRPAARVPHTTSFWASLFEERQLIRAGRALQAALPDVAAQRPPLG